jgi:hypothetical protein
MKKHLFVTSILLLTIINCFSQADSTFIVREISNSNHEWGNINTSNGVLFNTTSINPLLGLESESSCIDNQNGIIYFFEDYSGNNPSIVSIDINSGVTLIQNLANNNIGLLEYSSLTNKVYTLIENGSNYDWGEINPSTGNLSNVSSISTSLSEINIDGSCIDEANGLIYFFEYDISGNQSIVTLNINNGTSSKQLTSQEVRYVEFHNASGKLYTLTDNGTSVGWAEINPINGSITNFTTFTIPVIYIDDLPGSCMDQQNGIFYFYEIDAEGGSIFSIIGINVITGVVTKQTTDEGIVVLEHLNKMVTSIPESNILNTQVSLSPNPNNGVSYLEIKKSAIKNTFIEVSDLSGKVLFNQKITTLKTTINLADYPQGIYLVKFSSDLGSKVFKVIKE